MMNLTQKKYLAELIKEHGLRYVILACCEASIVDDIGVTVTKIGKKRVRNDK